MWFFHHMPGTFAELSGLLQLNAVWFTYPGPSGFGVVLNANMQPQREPCLATSSTAFHGNPLSKMRTCSTATLFHMASGSTGSTRAFVLNGLSRSCVLRNFSYKLWQLVWDGRGADRTTCGVFVPTANIAVKVPEQSPACLLVRIEEVGAPTSRAGVPVVRSRPLACVKSSLPIV